MNANRVKSDWFASLRRVMRNFRRIGRGAAKASTTAVYPVSHEEAFDCVMRVVDLIAACPEISDEELVARLMQNGVAKVDAELLVVFVPCAFSFALLKLMGLSNFPSTYQVQNNKGKWVEFPLAAEHYFTAALGVGHDIATRGYTERVNKAAFQAVSMRSAEMDAINKYFDAGGTREGLAGTTVGPSSLLSLTAEQIVASR